MTPSTTLLVYWVALTSAWTLLLFAYDKWRAVRSGRRIAEATLLLWSAVGGWPGGLLGIVLIRHKSSKSSFLIKFAVSGVLCGVLLALAWKSR